MISSLRLFRFKGPDHAAIVSVEPSSWNDGRWMIRVARGKSFAVLKSGQTFGPFPEDELADRFDEALSNLKNEGFGPAGNIGLLQALASENRAVRARAALLLGWRRASEAVEPLIDVSEEAIDEICSLVDALGMIGDERAIPLARTLAERKLLSRRRSGVEALRALGDSEGLALARQRGIERLPVEISELVATLDEEDLSEESLSPIVAALVESNPKRRGLYIDTLYEAGTPATVEAAGRALRQIGVGRPHLWRYSKSIFKRSMLRNDAQTFGWLVYKIEATARHYRGAKGKVRSGYDGKKRTTTIFSRKTVDYVRRAAWRHLRYLARYRPELYTEMAAECLSHYSSSDAVVPKGLNGAYSGCYLLNQILWRRSTRLRFDARGMKFKFRSSSTPAQIEHGRIEAFPALWDAYPLPFLRLARKAQLPAVREFAARGLKRHPEVLASASAEQLVELCGSESGELLEEALREVAKRLESGLQTTNLVEALLSQSQKRVWLTAIDWLKGAKRPWLGEFENVTRWLMVARGAAQHELTQLCIERMPLLSGGQRETLAALILAKLRIDVEDDTELLGLAAVARSTLTQELDRLLSVEDLLELVKSGSIPARTVAASVLGKKSRGLEALGRTGLIELAENEVSALREAARGLVLDGGAQLEQDPSVLFMFAESTWSDNRDFAIQQIRERLGFEELGLDSIIGLCDANHPDVQAFGRELVLSNFDKLDTQELLFRLIEHPDREMQKFAFSLITEHLRDGYVPLVRIEAFCRAVLFDVSAARTLKIGLIEFLTRRGLQDERQGEHVCSILSDITRTSTRGDFECVAESLVRLQLKWPTLDSPIVIAASGGEV